MKNQNQPATSFRHSTESSRRFVGVSPVIHGLAAVPAVRPLSFMNSRRRTILPLLTVTAVVLTGSIASAASYTFDTDQATTTATGAVGGTGAWDTSALNWTSDAGTTYVLWPNGSAPNGDTAIFGGTAGTVTVAASPVIEVNKITFSTAGYIVTGGTLNFSGTTPTVTKTTDATLSSTLTGTGGLTLDGAGAITINNAANTLSGGIKLSAGTLKTGADGSLGANVLTLAGGTFNPSANLSNNLVVTGNSIIERTSTGSHSVGTLSIGAQTLTISTTSGVGNGSITFGATTLTGSATIQNSRGASALGSPNASGYTPGATPPANAIFNAVTIGDTVGTGTTTTFTLNSTGNSNRFRATTLNGVLSDNATDSTKKLALTVNGDSHIVNLNGANTYSGNTTVTKGGLRLGAANRIPDGAGKGNVSLAFSQDQNGTVVPALNMNSFSETINGLSGNGTVDNWTGAGAPILTVGNNDATSTFTGVIKNTTGTLGLAKTGAGTLTLGGAAANTYSGATTISAGTLKLDGASGNVIPDGTGKGNVSLTGTLDMNSKSETINGLSGLGTVDNLTGIGATLTVGNNGATSTFDGVIQNAAGTLGLTKTGIGTLTLGGINTYTGDTTVSDGTLNLNDDAGFKFVIGASGTNNKVTGTGTVSLAGDFTFDLSGAAPEGSWTIVDTGTLTETFTSSFTVAGFTDNADDTWSTMVGSSTYTFSETNGLLTAVIPEPTSGTMVLGGLGMLLAWQNGRRRRNSAARGF
jgi:fibronectin-binding autotransporter adhesin